MKEEDDLLLRIYIGQGIYPTRGMLYDFRGQLLFTQEENVIIESLLGKTLVEKRYPYSSLRSMRTLVTTDKGEEESKKLIRQILDTDSGLLDELNANVPKKVMGFLVADLDFSVFEKTRNQSEYLSDWKHFALNLPKIFDFSIRFCQLLKRHRLAVLTNDYASSKGGQMHEEKYVISKDIKEYLIGNLKLVPFDTRETNQLILFYTMHKIKDILTIPKTEVRRNSFWNLLQTLPFDESAIESLVDKFADEKITTEYSEIDKEKFLFEILDKGRFNIKLSKLVDDFVSELVEGKKREPTIFPEASQRLKKHSELFVLIGNFETRFRDYLIKEMQASFKENENEWYNQLKEIETGDRSPFKTLYDKLEFRKSEDQKEGILPEKELINYADITDYKDIVLKNWAIFADKFNRIKLEKRKFEHGMNELNRIRRRVMHLRIILTNEAETLRLFIIPELEKISQ